MARGKCIGHSPGDEAQTLMRCHSVGCHSYMKPVGGTLSVTNLKLKGYKEENLPILFFLKLFLFYYSLLFGMMKAKPVVVGGGIV